MISGGNRKPVNADRLVEGGSRCFGTIGVFLVIEVIPQCNRPCSTASTHRQSPCPRAYSPRSCLAAFPARLFRFAEAHTRMSSASSVSVKWLRSSVTNSGAKAWLSGPLMASASRNELTVGPSKTDPQESGASRASISSSDIPRRLAETTWPRSQVGHRLIMVVRMKTSSFSRAGTEHSSDHSALPKAL